MIRGRFPAPWHNLNLTYFIKATPSDCVSHIVSQLKGYTANMLRKEFESLRRELPTLWTRSFYVESVGHISEQTIIKYIENQKNI